MNPRKQFLSSALAIKFLGKTKLLDLEEAERLSNEFFILTCIKHPNIVRLWEVVEDVTNLYLIMEYAGMLRMVFV